MAEQLNKTVCMLDGAALKVYNYLYTASIASEVVSSKGNNGGIIIMGMIVVIIGLVGYILTKNK